MVHIEIGERDNLQMKLREFRRAVVNAGIFDELRKRQCFRSPGEMKKYKRAVENKKRQRRNQRRAELAREGR